MITTEKTKTLPMPPAILADPRSPALEKLAETHHEPTPSMIDEPVLKRTRGLRGGWLRVG
jgi:hypothetical protein